MMQKSWKLAMGCIAAVAIMATNVRAQDEIASNVVGYVKVALEAGQLSLLAQPFDQVDGSANTVNNVLGTQVGIGTSVYVYDAEAGTYANAGRSALGWTAALPLTRGYGFWINSPAAVEILLMGQVPEEDSVMDVEAGLALYGNPVPVEQTIADSGLNAAPMGTSINFWDGSGYVNVGKSAFGWPAGTSIGMAEGFWMIAPSAFQWTEPAP
ncbi:MAG TPA: hypothetical protein DEW46_11750 [Verrucomicrobia bacterium]|jgi:hypothetical protein|nr:hypothetical protein [Verrucomicrobiota bacterium]